jgi:uncharacterized protein YjbJ (UPF0337 family)
MGIGDRAKQEGQNLVGKAKQLAGRARRDRPLEMEGKRQQNRAQLKKAGEHIRRAFKR